MIQVYSEWNTDYSHNGETVLDSIRCELTMELNGSWELELEVPLDEAGKFHSLVVNAVISAPTPIGERQLFRIYLTERMDDSVIAYARPIFLDSARDVYLVNKRPTNLTGQETLDYLMEGTPYTGTSDIQLKMTAYYIRKNLIEALAGNEDNSFLSRWGGEIIYDNYNIDISIRQGRDNGVRVEFGRNIEAITETINVDAMATRVVPVAFNGYTLEGDEPWVDSPLIDSYPIVYTKEVDFSNVRLTEDLDEGATDQEGYDTLEELREALKKQAAALFEDGVDLPTITYKINMTDLARTDDYTELQDLEAVSLGDTIRCYHRLLGIETEARVISLTYDCLRKAVKKITIGDYEEDYWTRLNGSMDASATTVDFESVSQKITYIESNYIKVGELEADIASMGFLTAEQAEITYAKITDLDAALISVNELLANYASIDYVQANYLTAESAVITDLTAWAENVGSLLAGNAGVGDLEAIHLTVKNAVIDDAVITDAMIVTLSADKLTAGTIYTDLVKIANNDGHQAWFDGATLQFSDAAGTVRTQIGMDASGEFNYYLWDENGKLTWNALGLTEAGLLGNGAIIRDAAVAGDAAISGSKLDITSVASCLSEEGSLIVSGSQVHIGDTTLDYELKTITEEIEGLEGVTFKGMVDFVPVYALGDSDTVPPLDDDDLLPALTDEAATDCSYTDVYEDNTLWTEDQPTQIDGWYLWMKYICYYQDGHTEKTPAMMITDKYLRSATSVLQTTLEVVEGRITAIVSETEILSDEITSISELYAELNVNLNGVSATVSSLQTTVSDNYTSLTSEISNLTTTANSISASVTAVEERMTDAESEIRSAEAKLELKVDADNLISIINASADVIELTGGRLIIDSDNCKLSTDGILQTTSGLFYDIQAYGGTFDGITAVNGSFAGDVAADSFSLVGTEMTVENRTISYNFYALIGSVISPSAIRFTGNMFCISNKNGMAVDGTLYAEDAVLEAGHLEDGSFETLTGNKLNAISLTVTGNFNTASAAAVNSDRALKSAIAPLDPKFDLFFDRLTARSYELKDAPGKKHLGLVVDEAETAMRNAGLDPKDWAITDRVTDADGKERGAIRYEELIALLVREVQELKEEVEKPISSDRGSRLYDNHFLTSI